MIQSAWLPAKRDPGECAAVPRYSSLYGCLESVALWTRLDVEPYRHRRRLRGFLVPGPVTDLLPVPRHRGGQDRNAVCYRPLASGRGIPRGFGKKQANCLLFMVSEMRGF